MKKRSLMGAIVLVSTLLTAGDCDLEQQQQPKSASGVNIARAKVSVNQATGMTVEQENVKERLQRDNTPGSIKHLYVISAFTGDVLLYSTVRGKVTSSGKRLTPTSVSSADGQYVGDSFHGFRVDIGGEMHRTNEVLQDDGTYGSSVEYVFWFDSKGVYHQYYPTGGAIMHVSDQPLRVAKAIINIDGPDAK